MDIDQVRELVKLVEESGIDELEISHDETTIRIQKSPTQAAGSTHIASAAALPAAAIQPAHLATPGAAVPAANDGASPALSESEANRANLKDVRSPIVGTFYRAASPTSDNFVNVGDRVAVGQPLCIVEAMKVMNEIEAEFAGTIKEILVENGSPVEAEGVLFLVDPD